jgi:isopenicillin N synthase-like dioxygenase
MWKSMCVQVKRKDGQWIAVKPCQEAFVVNVGAIFQVWSNDKYRGVEHRVVVNEAKERFSVPVFFDPDIRTDIAPVPQLLDETHPPHYQSYNWGFFRRTRNNGNFKHLGENIQIYHYAI